MTTLSRRCPAGRSGALVVAEFSLVLGLAGCRPAAAHDKGLTDLQSPAQGQASATAKKNLSSVREVPTCALPAQTTDSDVRTATNVTYATIQGKPLLLDLAYPNDPGPHPLIVLVHGGGFSTGDKRDKHQEMLMLAGQGYVAASVNYRLAKDDSVHFPSELQDLRCAVRWLRSNAAKYTIDPLRLGAQGDSAGGTIVALLGTTTDADPFDSPDCPTTPQTASANVNAVIANAGRTDVHPGAETTPAAALPIIAAYLGFDPRRDPGPGSEDKIKLASPVTHVTAATVPFLLIHGKKDPLVLSVQYETFAAKLKEVGVEHLLIDDPSWGHAPPIFSPKPPYRRALCSALAFLKAELKP